MSKSELTKDNFDKLLTWLDQDREIAAHKYRVIHRRLVKFYLGRKISTANELADETIDRVSRKVEHLIENYQGDPAVYFYKVAKNVSLEYLRTPKDLPLSQHLIFLKSEENQPEKNQFEEYYEHLEKCINTLSEENRRILIEYLENDKQTNNNQKELIKSLEMSVDLLRVRVFRTKKFLRKCINKCLEEKKM